MSYEPPTGGPPGAAGPPSGLPPPDWYPDPDNPGSLRYWDGSTWTTHRHTEGKLSGVGDWLSATFEVGARKFVPSLAIYVIVAVPMSILIISTLVWAIGDLTFIPDGDTGDFVNFEGGRFVIAAVVALFALLVQAVMWMAIARQMQTGHQQRDESIGASVSRALARAPRFLAVAAGLVVAAFVVLVLIGLATAAVPGLGVLLILAAIPLAIFVAVKLCFLSVAAVASPDGRNLVRLSADRSKGRFWGVLGRVVLLSIILAVVGAILGAITGLFTEPLTANTVDFIDPDEQLRFRDLLPSTGAVTLSAAVGAVVRSITAIFSVSGFARLYLDAGGPTD